MTIYANGECPAEGCKRFGLRAVRTDDEAEVAKKLIMQDLLEDHMNGKHVKEELKV